MKDTDRDITNHELWLYYTSGIARQSIIFDLYFSEGSNTLYADRAGVG